MNGARGRLEAADQVVGPGRSKAQADIRPESPGAGGRPAPSAGGRPFAEPPGCALPSARRSGCGVIPPSKELRAAAATGSGPTPSDPATRGGVAGRSALVCV
jgi:hypothetical protein